MAGGQGGKRQGDLLPSLHFWSRKMGIMVPACSKAGMTGEVQELEARDGISEHKEWEPQSLWFPNAGGEVVTAPGCIKSLEFKSRKYLSV